jgi:hypothetical protein
VAAWQREVSTLVDTLSELVVEVDRVTSGPPAAAGPSAPLDESALAEAVFTSDDEPGAPAFLPADAEADTDDAEPAAKADPARSDAPPARPGGVLDEVLACAREGLRPEDIARRVGRPVGEVTLMLGLSRAHPVPAGH